MFLSYVSILQLTYHKFSFWLRVQLIFVFVAALCPWTPLEDSVPPLPQSLRLCPT